jgi:5'-deoxynucleotidase YfbR-like HD superfamily hydrolase
MKNEQEVTPVVPTTIGKKKQIFKREKSKVIKAKISELKARSLKLKKKNLDQKAEKKKIAKEIHRLKASLKACEDIPKGKGALSDSEDEDMSDEKLKGSGKLD